MHFDYPQNPLKPHINTGFLSDLQADAITITLNTEIFERNRLVFCIILLNLLKNNLISIYT